MCSFSKHHIIPHTYFKTPFISKHLSISKYHTQVHFKTPYKSILKYHVNFKTPKSISKHHVHFKTPYKSISKYHVNFKTPYSKFHVHFKPSTCSKTLFWGVAFHNRVQLKFAQSKFHNILYKSGRRNCYGTKKGIKQLQRLTAQYLNNLWSSFLLNNNGLKLS